MLSLIYVSTVTDAFQREGLAALGEQAALANARLGVTGLLVYNGQHFMQLLEGEDAAVDQLLDRIARDERHSGLAVIRRDRRHTRECPNWSMRSFMTPLQGAGSATMFAARLPEAFAADTRVIFTSFASLPRQAA